MFLRKQTSLYQAKLNYAFTQKNSKTEKSLMYYSGNNNNIGKQKVVGLIITATHKVVVAKNLV